jgi:hypothetical protein
MLKNYEIKVRVNKKTEARAQVLPGVCIPGFVQMFINHLAIEH